MNQDCGESRRLTVAQWSAWAREGFCIPVSIPLEGDSMRPLIRRGRDFVTIVPVNRALRRGDVVLFEFPKKRYVVHRVYRLRGDCVQTLGDHCMNADAWMSISAVLGIAVLVTRGRKIIRLDTDCARWLGRRWMSLWPMRRLYFTFRAFGGKILRKLGWRKPVNRDLKENSDKAEE